MIDKIQTECNQDLWLVWNPTSIEFINDETASTPESTLGTFKCKNIAYAFKKNEKGTDEVSRDDMIF